MCVPYGRGSKAPPLSASTLLLLLLLRRRLLLLLQYRTRRLSTQRPSSGWFRPIFFFCLLLHEGRGPRRGESLPGPDIRGRNAAVPGRALQAAGQRPFQEGEEKRLVLSARAAGKFGLLAVGGGGSGIFAQLPALCMEDPATNLSFVCIQRWSKCGCCHHSDKERNVWLHWGPTVKWL